MKPNTLLGMHQISVKNIGAEQNNNKNSQFDFISLHIISKPNGIQIKTDVWHNVNTIIIQYNQSTNENYCYEH